MFTFFMSIHLHCYTSFFLFFFFNAPAPTEIYTLSLHDALPIYSFGRELPPALEPPHAVIGNDVLPLFLRSEEHTSELQSHLNLVCRLLLEKKKKKKIKKKNKYKNYE